MIKCFLVAMMSLEDNKHALYQLLAHPKYVGNLILCRKSGVEGDSSDFLNVTGVFLQVRRKTCYLPSNASLGF